MSFFETCDYAEGVKLLNEAGSRALWALTTKHYNTKGFSFQVFEKLYFNTVVPVTDYASEIWGYKKYDFLDRRNLELPELSWVLVKGRSCHF